ncbi:MAG TPA: metallophosphoesterase family protein [Candidatus Dormibacteraeota bacterium]|nr:metallophosphoesterase family protein [Candidatus Dormibacteraeota bacterium]
MRLAVVSDIHGNLPALEAVLADLEATRPDAVVLGGDLALGGPHPVEVVDRLLGLGWPSVLGNTDEALDEERLPAKLRASFVGQAAARTREMLGSERVTWLTSRPLEWRGDGVAVVHATPADCWSIVAHDAPDQQLREVYGAAGAPAAIYGHIHHAFVRELEGLSVANSGSVSLSLDGDTRACYLIIDGGRFEHRRVVYDIERVASDFETIGYPNAMTYATWLRTGEYPSQ